ITTAIFSPTVCNSFSLTVGSTTQKFTANSICQEHSTYRLPSFVFCGFIIKFDLFEELVFCVSSVRMDRKSIILKNALILTYLNIPKYESTKGLRVSEIDILLLNCHKLFIENKNKTVEINNYFTDNKTDNLFNKEPIIKNKVKDVYRDLIKEHDSPTNTLFQNNSLKASFYEDSGNDFISESEYLTSSVTDDLSSDISEEKKIQSFDYQAFSKGIYLNNKKDIKNRNKINESGELIFKSNNSTDNLFENKYLKPSFYENSDYILESKYLTSSVTDDDVSSVISEEIKIQSFDYEAVSKTIYLNNKKETKNRNNTNKSSKLISKNNNSIDNLFDKDLSKNLSESSESSLYEDSGDDYIPESEYLTSSDSDNLSPDGFDEEIKINNFNVVSEAIYIDKTKDRLNEVKKKFEKRDEIQIQEILAIKVGDKRRKFLFNKLRNEGNFLKGTTEENIVPVRKLTGFNSELPSSLSHLPCKYCRGFYKKEYLYKHVKTCPHNYDDKSTKCNAQSEGQSLFSAYVKDDILRKEVFPTMRADSISFAAKTDSLICAVARRYLRSHREKQFRLVASRKMRQLATLLIELKKKINVKNLMEALDPLNFDQIVECTKIISKFDSETETYGAPSLASNMATLIKDSIDVAYTLILKKNRGESPKTNRLKTLKDIITRKSLDEININLDIIEDDSEDENDEDQMNNDIVETQSIIHKINEFKKLALLSFQAVENGKSPQYKEIVAKMVKD
ncbi:unnamed protein product, partial [Brassicogethes aeneus]